MKAVCERLLHPSVTDAAERARQLRLLAVLLAAPVLAAVATAEIAVARVGMAAALVSVAMVFGVGLLAPVALIATARRRLVEPCALVLAAMAVCLLVAAGGGLASPFSALAAGFVVEAGWVGRSRRAIIFGLSAAIAAVLAGAGLAAVLAADAVAPSAWHWLVPLLYAGTIPLRLPVAVFAGEERPVEPETPDVETIAGAAMLRLQPTGDVTFASRRSEALLGIAPEILLGSGLFDRIHISDRIAWLSALSNLREGADRQAVRLRIRVPAEGMPTDTAYGTFLCEMAAGPGREVFALLRDDQVPAALEQELEEARQAAENAVLARDQLLASVSHELRTPLNAIVGFSDVLANEMFGRFANERQREYVGLIREAGGHLLSVVNAILDVSKLRSGTYELEIESFRLDEAVDLCIAMTAHQANAKSLKLTADVAADIGTVHCDRRALQQVLVNLLSNAVKFTPAGEVKVTARRSGGRLELTVSDTGIGMSAEDLKRVGKPFMQVQNDYTRNCEGTGLGLALVKGLVRLQGGGMSIESAPGAGTRVHVSLPAGGTDDEREGEETDALATNWNGGWNHDALRKTA